jgi:hypothetical protein
VNSPLALTQESSQKKKEQNLPKQKNGNSAGSSMTIHGNASLNSSVIISSALNPDVANALKQFSEEQNNKTKKLLSDLNTKRRSRQRKSIIVVNTGNPPRNIVPKLNFNLGNEHILSLTNNIENNMNNLGVTNVNSPSSGILSPSIIQGMSNENLNNNQQLQQNIVYSKPVAAVVRQIVNNVSTIDSLNSSPKSSSTSFSAQNSKTAVPNFHQIFTNLIENNSKSSNEDIINNESKRLF